MKRQSQTAFVRTIKERCRMCYTCVRECPAKAIRIVEGQAEIMGERCIACGNCVRVCSQKAKQVVRSVDDVEQLLSGPGLAVTYGIVKIHRGDIQVKTNTDPSAGPTGKCPASPDLICSKNWPR